MNKKVFVVICALTFVMIACFNIVKAGILYKIDVVIVNANPSECSIDLEEENYNGIGIYQTKNTEKGKLYLVDDMTDSFFIKITYNGETKQSEVLKTKGTELRIKVDPNTMEIKYYGAYQEKIIANILKVIIGISVIIIVLNVYIGIKRKYKNRKI